MTDTPATSPLDMLTSEQYAALILLSGETCALMDDLRGPHHFWSERWAELTAARESARGLLDIRSGRRRRAGAARLHPACEMWELRREGI